MSQPKEESDVLLIKFRNQLLDVNDENVKMRQKIQLLEAENERLRLRLEAHARTKHSMMSYTPSKGTPKMQKPATTPRLSLRKAHMELFKKGGTPPRTAPISSLENAWKQRSKNDEGEDVLLQDITGSWPPNAASD